MPLFRRSPRAPAPTEVRLGVMNHRLLLGARDPGIANLDELRTYVQAVTGGAARPGPDGRDTVAVLSAKMDQAEMVNDTVNAAALALDELVDRGVIAPGDIPEHPALPPVPERAAHYDYIQAAHRRAEVRLGWLTRVDDVLRSRDVALLPPRPDEDPSRLGEPSR